jgi:hypothetical protein
LNAAEREKDICLPSNSDEKALMMTGEMPVLQAFSWFVVPEKGM